VGVKKGGIGRIHFSKSPFYECERRVEEGKNWPGLGRKGERKELSGWARRRKLVLILELITRKKKKKKEKKQHQQEEKREKETEKHENKDQKGPHTTGRYGLPSVESMVENSSRKSYHLDVLS